MQYLIDIVGTCILRCPSCPVGNVKNTSSTDVRPKGFMEFELFTRILDRIQADCSARSEPIEVFLYNWGEPLIHPRIVDFVSELARRHIRFFISTNFNIEAPLKPIVRANPAVFRISVSGYFRETYA